VLIREIRVASRQYRSSLTFSIQSTAISQAKSVTDIGDAFPSRADLLCRRDVPEWRWRARHRADAFRPTG